MNDTLTIAREPGRWTFTLARPEKRNALCAQLIESLIEGVESADAEQVPLLVFQGEGQNFSAGFDFTGYEDQSDGDLLLRMVRIEHLLQRIGGLSALTVAFAHGRNFGAGVDLFAVCKQRYCTPDASFRMPGLKFGLVLGTRRFRDIVGSGNALSILSSARSFDADEALRIGFVQKIAASSDWPGLIEHAATVSVELDREAREGLTAAVRDHNHDADMAALVRSASRPGFKDRIGRYLAR